MNLTLQWHGPFPLPTFVPRLSELWREFSERGVYLWIDRRDPEQICYVGKATGSPNLWLRQFDHYVSIIGGRSLIPDSHQGRDPIWEIDRDSDQALETMLDKERYCSVVRKGFAYSRQLAVCLCSLPDASSVDLRVLENNLLYDLRPRDTRYPARQPNPRLTLVHANAVWATPSVLAQVLRFEGA